MLSGQILSVGQFTKSSLSHWQGFEPCTVLIAIHQGRSITSTHL
nr:MAG TPA: hypothetical protein [Caudoviricetes sp.]